MRFDIPVDHSIPTITIPFQLIVNIVIIIIIHIITINVIGLITSRLVQQLGYAICGKRQ